MPEGLSFVTFAPSLSALDVLDQAQSGRLVLQDFRPLAESLEWELGQEYLRQRGSLAFIGDADDGRGDAQDMLPTTLRTERERTNRRTPEELCERSLALPRVVCGIATRPAPGNVSVPPALSIHSKRSSEARSPKPFTADTAISKCEPDLTSVFTLPEIVLIAGYHTNNSALTRIAWRRVPLGSRAKDSFYLVKSHSGCNPVAVLPFKDSPRSGTTYTTPDQRDGNKDT
jgi:hypothetical protein